MNLKTAVNDYLNHCSSSLADNTVESYRRTLVYFLSFVGVDVSTCRISSRTIRKFLQRKREEGLANSTIRLYGKHLQAFFKFIAKDGVINAPPEFNLPPKKEREPKFLRDDQVDELLRICESRDAAIVMLMLQSGLRVSEVAKLRWDDLDWIEEKHLLRIHVKEGKGDKSRITYARSDVYRALSSLNTADKEVFEIGRKSIINMFTRKSKELPFKVTSHMLRHSFARNFIRNGGSVRILQDLLGHSDLQTTQIYMMLDDSDTLDAYERMYMKREYYAQQGL